MINPLSTIDNKNNSLIDSDKDDDFFPEKR